jgi:hypothetical protein
MPMSAEEALLMTLVKTVYQQHQDLIPLDDHAAWLRRFALGYSLQKEHSLWSDEEWERITQHDLPNYFRQHPQAITVWHGSLRQYWPKEVVLFIDRITGTIKSET